MGLFQAWIRLCSMALLVALAASSGEHGSSRSNVSGEFIFSPNDGDISYPELPSDRDAETGPLTADQLELARHTYAQHLVAAAELAQEVGPDASYMLSIIVESDTDGVRTLRATSGATGSTYFASEVWDGSAGELREFAEACALDDAILIRAERSRDGSSVWDER